MICKQNLSRILVPVFLLLTTQWAWGQEVPDVELAPAKAPTMAIVPLPELNSPRATVTTFLRAMREKKTLLAASCLDLGNLTEEAAQTSGPNVAYQLHVVMQRLTELSLDEKWLLVQLPDENDFAEPCTLAGLTGSSPQASALILTRSPQDANWRFSQETCEGIEELYNKLEQLAESQGQKEVAKERIDQPFPIRLRGWFPVNLRQTTLLLPDYQWICLLVLIFIGLFADTLTRWIFSAISTRWLGKDLGEEELAARSNLWRPVGRLANAAVWYWGTKLIGLPPSTLNVLLAVFKLYTIFAATWTAFAIIDIAAKYLARQALRTSTKFDDLLVPMLSKSFKILATCLALLTAAQTFDIPVMGLVGGLGLGGAALAFASKDAVSNFFGSITVLLDRPFEVGDWIVTEGVEGTVEQVGFRSTRVRTFYNSLITLPNSHLTTATVDNMGRRVYRRIKTTLGLQYDTTPEQLEAFCEGVRELIRRHPSTRKDYFHVYFNDFGPSSLDIMLYCFVQCPDWGAELAARHELLSSIMQLAQKLDVQFAFPTRTLHMIPTGQEPPPPSLEQPLRAGKGIRRGDCGGVVG